MRTAHRDAPGSNVTTVTLIDAFMTDNLDGGIVGFLYDANTDGGTDLGLVDSAPFLSFTDVYIDATVPTLIEVSFTAGSEDTSIVDQKIRIPNWPSSDALILLMLQ